MNRQKRNKFNFKEFISLLLENKKEILFIALFAFVAYVTTTLILNWHQVSEAFMSGWNSVE